MAGKNKESFNPERVERIRELLTAKPMTASELAKELDMKHNSLISALCDITFRLPIAEEQHGSQVTYFLI